MTQLHTALGWPLAIAAFVVGIWALTAHWVPAARRQELWYVIWASEAMIFVQAFLGVAALSNYPGERPGFHIFYGFLAMTTCGILYAYRTYEGLHAHRYLLYGLGSLFIGGLLVRAVYLDPADAASMASFGLY